MNMKKKRGQPADAVALRHRAEAKLSEHKKKAAPSPAAEADSLRLVHELQVHQIELEMQNEELIQARTELEEAYRQFSNLYDFAPVGYFTLARNGTIHDANLAGANLLQVERGKLIKRRFGLFVSVESRPAFSTFFEKLLSGDGKKSCELALLKNGEAMFWARLEATCFEGGQECRAVLVDITARRQVEESLLAAHSQLQAHVAEIEKLQIELREQAIRDPLTGLYNRRYLFESLSREVPRAVREGYPISIILLDIDHFKIINDTFGHDAGDKALRVLATQLKTLSRVEDIVCRYGGDEHLIVMHNTTADKALERADQLRKAIARRRVSHAGKTFKFTVSFGVAVFPVYAATIEEVISAADYALYQSKKAGRNRVTVL